jgi:hypothetical protein
MSEVVKVQRGEGLIALRPGAPQPGEPVRHLGQRMWLVRAAASALPAPPPGGYDLVLRHQGRVASRAPRAVWVSAADPARPRRAT